MRINHVEVSVPRGTLTDAWCARIGGLLVGVLGWSADGVADASPPGAQPVRRAAWRLRNGQSLVTFEDETPTRAGAADHFGVQLDPEEMRSVFDGCQRLAAADTAMEFQHLVDDAPSRIPMGAGAYRTFFVRYLLPVWIQMECWEDG